MSHVQDVQRAVLRSNLAAPGRHIVMALAVLADYDTGVIPERFTPSITELCAMTGLGRSTVTEHLNINEDQKWVERERPSDYEARVLKRKTRYTVRIGLGVTPGLVRQADQPKYDEPDNSSSELDRLADQASPVDGPAKEDETDMSESVLVRETDQASPPGGREVPTKEPPKEKTSSSSQSSKPTKEPKPPSRGTRIPTDFAVTPEMIDWARTHTPLVGAAETDAFIDWARSNGTQRAVKTNWIAAWRNWMRTEQKRVAERRSRYGGGESNAPRSVPKSEVCPKHEFERADSCGACASEAKGRRR